MAKLDALRGVRRGHDDDVISVGNDVIFKCLLEMMSSVSHRNPLSVNLNPREVRQVRKAREVGEQRERMKAWLPTTCMVRREETAANDSSNSTTHYS